MPQMAPLNWMLILVLTSMIITMINCINYSNYQKPSTLTNKLNKSQTQKNPENYNKSLLHI